MPDRGGVMSLSFAVYPTPLDGRKTKPGARDHIPEIGQVVRPGNIGVQGAVPVYFMAEQGQGIPCLYHPCVTQVWRRPPRPFGLFIPADIFGKSKADLGPQGTTVRLEQGIIHTHGCQAPQKRHGSPVQLHRPGLMHASVIGVSDILKIFDLLFHLPWTVRHMDGVGYACTINHEIKGNFFFVVIAEFQLRRKLALGPVLIVLDAVFPFIGFRVNHGFEFRAVRLGRAIAIQGTGLDGQFSSGPVP